MRSSISLHWRLNSQRYRLVGSGCATCGHVAFPPRKRCPICAENPLDLSFDQAMTTSEKSFVAELPQLALEKHAVH